MPSFIGGLKQGWAFAWRSLLAGELSSCSREVLLGRQLDATAQLRTTPASRVMIVILVIGVIIDIVDLRQRGTVHPPAVRAH